VSSDRQIPAPLRPIGSRLSHLSWARLRTNLLVPTLVVGVGGGLVGAAYLAVLHFMTDWIGPEARSLPVHAVILVAVGGTIALVTRLLGDSGSVDLLVDNIHVLGGDKDLHQTRALVPTSLLSIAAGGAMGPEAPLVQTNGSLGTWVAQRFELDTQDMRTLTITGMAAGFAVLFGAPLGAALFALEILHRRGLQYYEAILPAVAGSLVGYALYFGLSGVGLEPVWHLPDAGPLAGTDLVWGIACGVLGAIGALVFIGLVNAARWAISRIPPWCLPIVAGALLGALAWWSPYALTNGETQVDPLLAGSLTLGALSVAIAAKLAGVVVTLAGRWKGGFIIPLFFIGIAGGQLLHILVPSTNTTVLMVALAVALCVGVTKTPLGSTLVVTQMAGVALLPMSITAAVVSLVLTSQTVAIETQRGRSDHTEVGG
jgi:H+/Cl- antiporter ClcA